MIKELLDKIIGPERTGYFLSYIQERKYLKPHYRDGQAKDGIFEGIVYMADGRMPLGGISDRLRGMVSLYNYCKNKNIPFAINFVHPFLLTEYLEPNIYDWRINDELLSYVKGISTPLFLRPYSTRDDIDTSGYVAKKLSCYGKVKQLHVYSNITLDKDSFSSSFKELFKPAGDLQNEIDINRSRIGEKYISISFRFMALLGDFKDLDSKPLAENEKNELIDKCIAAIERVKQENEGINKVLVTSDSATFISVVTKRLDYVVVMSGEIAHMDHAKGGKAHMRTFVDMLMIAGAERAYVYATGAMYRNSSFAETAALIGGVPFSKIIE